MMPLQVNWVQCPAVMGSNTASTKQFLQGLKPFQRRAIRKMEIRLLASVTEAWSLKSILRMIADVSEVDQRGDMVRSSCSGEVETSSSSKHMGRDTGKGELCLADGSDLQELVISTTMRNLMLAQADSLVGLMHILSVPAEVFAGPYIPFACTAAWVTEGLVHLKRLRKLTIVLEISGSVASQLSIEDEVQFPRFVRSTLQWVEVDVQWLIQKDIVLAPDDDEWVNLL